MTNEPPLLFQSHSTTSFTAAASKRPAARQRRLVLEALIAAGDAGLTDEEMQGKLHLQGSSQRPRRVELQGMGLVIDSGRTRRTLSGRMAVVWVVKP